MKFPSLRWYVLLLSIVVTVSVLAGGELAYDRYVIAKPLTLALEQIDGIQDIKLKESVHDKSVEAHLTLNHVDKLDITYKAVNDALKAKLNNKKYTIVIHDNRTPELEKLYYDIHYYVQEAIITGNFGLMAERIDRRANDLDIKSRVYVDVNNVYLTFIKKNAEMYVVVPRHIPTKEVK